VRLLFTPYGRIDYFRGGRTTKLQAKYYEFIYKILLFLLERALVPMYRDSTRKSRSKNCVFLSGMHFTRCLSLMKGSTPSAKIFLH